MAKLFATEDLDTNEVSEVTIDAKIENSDIPNITDDYEGTIQVVTEGFQRAANDLFIVSDIQASLAAKKLSSVEYFTSIENYSLYMKSISNNLGVDAKIPSMEDFKNPFGIKASHQFVMEGFVEFIRSIWEKIKSFFKEFFKRIMLFLKRLVNANLELDEYEKYIDELMHRVKRSENSRVEPVKVESKLPGMLTDYGMEELNTEYLMTRGLLKLDNLASYITVLTDRVIPNFLAGIESATNDIKGTFGQGYRPTPEAAAEFTSTTRDKFVNSLRTIFTFQNSLKELPEDVYSNVMNMFDSHQLGNGNTEFISVIEERNKLAAMPMGYNMFLVVSNFGVSLGERDTRTSKVYITSSVQKNTHTQSSMHTITNKGNLLKIYDFYKEYSKEVKIKNVEKRIDNLQDIIFDMTKKLDQPFRFALENDDLASGNTTGFNIDTSDPELQHGNPGGFGAGVNFPNTDTNDTGRSNEEDPSRELVRKEIKEFQRFIFGYMDAVQAFVREMTVNGLGTYEQTRYELIKLIYKSGKQF